MISRRSGGTRDWVLTDNSILNSFSSRRERGYIINIWTMWRKIPDIIKQAARDLRRNMTGAERQLWSELKNEKIWYRINRQSPIYVFTEDFWLDRYIIADFYCPEKKLIIEIDGIIHDREDIYFLDREKEKLLLQAWYTVLRYKNDELLSDINWAIRKIQKL